MRKLLVAASAIAIIAGPAMAQPRYKLNKAQTKVVSLSGLSSGGECLHDRLSGKVVSMQYAANGVVLEGFALEGKAGDRDFINVDVDNIQAASMVTIGWVKQGLEQFIRKGKRVSIGALRCGAAGRVLYLDSIGAK